MKSKFIKSMILLFFVANSVFGSGYIKVTSPQNVNIGTCQTFPDNNYWNTPVDNLPVDSRSTAWVSAIGANRNFHMDFGSGNWDGGPIGIPYNVVSGSDSAVHFYNFSFLYSDESDPGPYPLPAFPEIEYGSDHHILTIDTDDCMLYEVYDADKQGSTWHGGSGAVWSLDSNTLRPGTWTSADAAGLPILPGLARYEEVSAGVIEHALRFTANCTADYFIWPARHKAPYGSCNTPVPFGARFRLKNSFNTSGYSPQARVLLEAFKKYGIVLADNSSSSWYISGAPHVNWNNQILHELDNLTGSNFEAVNTTVLMTDPNSAATKPFTGINTVVFLGTGENDGYILESAESSNKGGSMNSASPTLNIGDNAANKQYRAILSFDTSTLPDNAVITAVRLKVKYAGKTGTLPFKTHGNLLVDVRRGPFSGNLTLQLGDFRVAATKNNILSYTSSNVNQWYTRSFNAASFQYISVDNITQFRLRFSKDDNNDRGADFLKMYSGDANEVDRPVLVISYYAP